MKLPENILDCSALEIARDIPKELTFYKNHCKKLVHHNQLYKNILIGTTASICLYIIYKTITHYAKKKENNSEFRSEEDGEKHPNY